jgi:hypothetical protein
MPPDEVSAPAPGFSENSFDASLRTGDDCSDPSAGELFMMSCPQCAHVVEEGQVVCPLCGTSVIASAADKPEPIPSFVPASAEALPPSPPMFSTPNDLEGIGGWVILIAIGLVISPFYILGSSVLKDVEVFSNPRIQAVFDNHPGLQSLIVAEIVTNLVVVAFMLVLNYLFFTKRRSFPAFFICILVFQFAFLITDTIAAHAVMPNYPLSANAFAGILRSIVGAAIWIPYMLVSRRVKATFVR